MTLETLYVIAFVCLAWSIRLGSTHHRVATLIFLWIGIAALEWILILCE